MTASPSSLRNQFKSLHESGTFIIPNPFDVGSAVLLQHLGFLALATTSSGFAATLGRVDQHVTRDELVAHVHSICDAVDIPVNVDAEGCYADDPGGISQTIALLAEAGAAGISIEDYDPNSQTILSRETATARVAMAADACRTHGIVLTARAEQLLYGNTDLDDVIRRLNAYRSAGADVLYAPGVTDLGHIRTLVNAVNAPINVLASKGAPSVPELGSVGVRRVSTGGNLAWMAYGAMVAAAIELHGPGTSSYLDAILPTSLRKAAFERP